MRNVPDTIVPKLMIACELIARQGLDHTKMEDIAALTGVPKATLYYYFASKEDLLAHLFQQLLNEVHDVVGAAAAGPGSAADRLAAVIDAHLDLFERRRHASTAMQFDLGRAARHPELTTAVDRSFLSPVSALLKAGAKDKSLRRVVDQRATATAILGAITATGLGGHGQSGHKAVLDLVLDGLRP